MNRLAELEVLIPHQKQQVRKHAECVSYDSSNQRDIELLKEELNILEKLIKEKEELKK